METDPTLRASPAVNGDSPADAPPAAAESVPIQPVKTPPVQIALLVCLTIGFLYFGRPVVLPVILACVGAMTLKPLIRWSTNWHIPPALSAAVVLCSLTAAVGIGFFQLGRPAMAWINEAPQRMTELRQRAQDVFPRITRLTQAADAVNNLGASEDEKREIQKKAPMVEVKDSRGTDSVINWTGAFLVGLGETLVLLYLLLASGDLFLQKLVQAMPTWSDKKRAVEISHEIQQNISNYLFSVSLINAGLGILLSTGLYFMGVPNAAMWGLIGAVLNFVPYFGPVVGVLLLAAMGLLSFDRLGPALLPAGWFVLLHLIEANFVTPVLLGRRFTLNPAIIFVSLIFWTSLWGVAGALLSVPILVTIKIFCDRVPTLATISDLMSGAEKVVPQPDAR